MCAISVRIFLYKPEILRRWDLEVGDVGGIECIDFIYKSLRCIIINVMLGKKCIRGESLY